MWYDGSVGDYEGDKHAWSRRVAVRSVDDRLTAILYPIPDQTQNDESIHFFRTKRNIEPSMWIHYDDGYTMAYKNSSAPYATTDSDGHTHEVQHSTRKIGHQRVRDMVERTGRNRTWSRTSES